MDKPAASEQALAVSLAQLRATLEATTDGVLVVDHADQVLHYNQNFLRLWGLPEAALGSRLLEDIREQVFSHFADPLPLRARVNEIYTQALPETFDVLELKDGRVFERYSRLQVVDGRPIGRVWSFRDTTLQRRAEAALRDETHLLELLNRIGISLTSKLDVQGVVQAVTDAATELSGARFGAFFYTAQEDGGGLFKLFALSGAPRAAFEKLGHPRATGLFGPTFVGEGPIRIADVRRDARYGHFGPHHGMPPGHLPVVSYLAVPVISRSGEVLGGLFFGHPEADIFTERAERIITGIAAQAAVAMDNARLYEMAQKAASERATLLEAERAARSAAERMSEVKDQFLATLSHELRTPLSAILGWAQVLKRAAQPASEGADDKLLKGLETIERNARVQTQLIDDLLDMSRIASGKLRLDIQSVVPITFIEAAIQSQMPAAAARGIRIERMLDPLAGPISGDPSRLQQVMWNLLSNAIKFTPQDGKVQVTLARVNSHIEINVADTGIGIEPEFLPHVFERFQQADASTTRKYGGLGLGLSIVKNLVELHGGTVLVKSAGKGQGATFAVHLPVTVVHRDDGERRHPAAGAEAGVFSTVDLAGLKVLVVDDEPDARELVRHILAECGAQVRAAAGPAEALAMIDAEAPDVLVSDIGMPEMDGFELLRRVRALREERGWKLSAIALTAFARSEDRIRALNAGFLMHLSKPVEPSELIATVASIAARNL